MMGKKFLVRVGGGMWNFFLKFGLIRRELKLINLFCMILVWSLVGISVLFGKLIGKKVLLGFWVLGSKFYLFEKEVKIGWYLE